VRHLRQILLCLSIASTFACVLAILLWIALCNGGMFDKRGYRNPPVFQAEWLGVRMWLAVVATAALPLTQLVLYVRRRLYDPPSSVEGNSCPECGYDCRATPERCPECGSALAVTATTPAREGKGETAGV
jgi:hypothetical protein